MDPKIKEEALQRIKRLQEECLDILGGLRELNDNLSKSSIKGIDPFGKGAYKCLKTVIKQRRRLLVIHNSFIEALEAQKKLLKLRRKYERK